jgi:acylphosphatase
MNQTTSRLHAIVEGRVQGVGFRFFVHEVALRLGLTGWVRNCPDGAVEVVAEGDRNQLTQLIQELNKAHAMPWLLSLRTDWEIPTGEFTQFKFEGLLRFFFHPFPCKQFGLSQGGKSSLSFNRARNSNI